MIYIHTHTHTHTHKSRQVPKCVNFILVESDMEELVIFLAFVIIFYLKLGYICVDK